MLQLLKYNLTKLNPHVQSICSIGYLAKAISKDDDVDGSQNKRIAIFFENSQPEFCVELQNFWSGSFAM